MTGIAFRNRKQWPLFSGVVLICWSVLLFQPRLGAAPLQQKSSDAKKAGSNEAAAGGKQEAAKSSGSGAPKIGLDEITGSPGASLMIPLYYTPAANEPMRSLTVDIEYVSSHLKFQKAAAGVIPEDLKVDISTNVTDGAPDAKGTVRSKLRVSVSVDKSSTKPLPEALLSYLLFQVTMDAKPFVIKMTPSLVSAEEMNNQKVAKFNFEPGTVTVETPDLLPEATCFFFNH
jgi:hypothetical protein